MRVYLTGASGFVGSNLARVFAARGAELVTPGHDHVDLTDAALVKLPGLDSMLRRLRAEIESCWRAA